MHSQSFLRRIQIRVRQMAVLCILALCAPVTGIAVASPLNEKSFQDPVSGQTVGVIVPLSLLNRKPVSGGVTSLAAGDAEQIALAAIKEHSSQIGLLNPETQLRKQKLETDDQGVTHVQFQQIMGQVPVFGSQITVHLNPAKDSVMINGRASQE